MIFLVVLRNFFVVIQLLVTFLHIINLSEPILIRSVALIDFRESNRKDGHIVLTVENLYYGNATRKKLFIEETVFRMDSLLFDFH